MRLPDLRALPYQILRRITLPPNLFWQAARLVNRTFLLGVAGVIRDDQGRLLLFHHTYRRRRPWGLPGGWMRQGESPLQALEREVYEESQLTVRAERLLLIGTTADRPKLEFVVQARLLEGSFQPSHEVSEMRWFDDDQLPPLPHSHLLILQQVAQLAPGEVGCYSAPWVFIKPS